MTSAHHSHQPLLVRAAGIDGGLAGFIVKLAQFFPGDGDDLRAYPSLLDLLLQLSAQMSVFEERFPLLLSELEWIVVAPFLVRWRRKTIGPVSSPAN